MITERDLQEAIAECQGIRDPNANTCIKLAAFYIILDHIKTKDMQNEPTKEPPAYSYSAAPLSLPSKNSIYYDSDSEFARKISGMEYEQILPVMDELMETLSILNPGLYNGVMRKLSEV